MYITGAEKFPVGVDVGAVCGRQRVVQEGKSKLLVVLFVVEKGWLCWDEVASHSSK
jgi:hypothetical protein